MALILSTTDAAAVYSAMCALNNIGATIHARLYTTNAVVHIKEFMTGEVDVWEGDPNGNLTGSLERYRIQAEFAAAYGL